MVKRVRAARGKVLSLWRFAWYGGGRGSFWIFMQTFLFHASVTEIQARDIFLELICGVCICNQKRNTIGLKIERSWWVEVSNSSQRNLSLALRIQPANPKAGDEPNYRMETNN